MTKVPVITFIIALAFIASGADAMTVQNDAMMKEKASTTDAMMKKDDAMMSSSSDAMMKKDEGAMMKKEVMAAPQLDLSMGSRGEDVVALQTFLVSKSLLVMPAGVAMGYFGPLTKAALMSYQASNSLPSTGYYGPLTRAAMSAGMMMKKDEGAMMKKDDAMMSSSSDAMMKKDEDAMMKKDEAMMKEKTQ
ncbi:MAG: trimeric autotransporter adhesin [Candidatus Parcubacteria bacterium]|jgi:hypothetical protein